MSTPTKNSKEKGGTSLPKVTPTKTTNNAPIIKNNTNIKSDKLPSINNKILPKSKNEQNNNPIPAKKSTDNLKTPQAPQSMENYLSSEEPPKENENSESKEKVNPTLSPSDIQPTSDIPAVLSAQGQISDIVPIPNPEPVKEQVPAEPSRPNNGKVTLIYEQYNEQFDIVNGSTNQEAIDEVYCLSFVMPNCLIHLSKHNPTVKRQLECEEKFDDLFILESPRGTFIGLFADDTYYVYVEQEEAQLARDQARMRQIANSMEGINDKKRDKLRDDGRAMESCSCIYGNPCVDEYGCKDWDNRFAIATKNGWKGF